MLIVRFVVRRFFLCELFVREKLDVMRPLVPQLVSASSIVQRAAAIASAVEGVVATL
jgi:hypothetical protein